jgi:hypothetical protein
VYIIALLYFSSGRRTSCFVDNDYILLIKYLCDIAWSVTFSDGSALECKVKEMRKKVIDILDMRYCKCQSLSSVS